MHPRGVIAGVTVGLLAITMTGALSGPAVADADGTLVAGASLPGRPLVSQVRMVPMAVTDDGKTLVTVTTAGITKYAVTRRAITRLGRNTATPDDWRLDVEVLPNGRYAYVTDQPYYGPKTSRMQIFDLRKDRPRLVRTLKFPGLGRVNDTEMTPDGRRLFLRANAKVKVLRLGHPARPKRGAGIHEPDGTGPLKITADGTRMVTAATRRTEGTGGLVRVWDITQPGAPVFERERMVVLPGPDTRSRVSDLAISPQGDAIYVGSTYCNGACEDTYTETTRLRFSDLTTEAQTAHVPGVPFDFLEAVSNGGSKVFVRTGWTTDEPETLPRGLAWLDPELTTHHKVDRVGNVRGMAVSPGGRTRGTVYVAGRKSGKLRISAVRF